MALAGALVLALASLCPLSARAAAGPVDNLLFTAGTTRTAGNQEWAYLVWQSNDPSTVRGQVFALYAKPGAAGAAGAYTRQAVVQTQSDPGVIAVLLERSLALGQDLAMLEEGLDNLFRELMPGTDMPLAQKLSVVIRGSLDRPDYFDNLLFLGRLHPGVGLCLGVAHAQILASPGETTFEIRPFDLAGNRDLGVVGRVTLTAGQPTILPPPGPPVQVPQAGPQGDLNVRLRWAMPVELRRLFVLHYGFNVYRMPKAYAEEHNFHLQPPPPGTLVAMSQMLPEVRRLNELPVLKTKDFDPTQPANPTANPRDVANFLPEPAGDPDTYFLADDNGRYLPGGTAFTNGQAFYYFVTARDILGRDVSVSLGGLGLACDQLPPSPPVIREVLNAYLFDDTDPQHPRTNQFLKVVWETPPHTDPADPVAAYYVYRWNKPSDPLDFENLPQVNRIAGPIPWVAGQETRSYVDNGPGAPTMAQDAGKTFWYTVRAEDNGACQGNLSPNSGPVFGVLRDREGPPPPVVRRLQARCTAPVVAYQAALPLAWPDSDFEQAGFQLVCTRSQAGAETIQWAEFYTALPPALGSPVASSNFAGRAWFPTLLTPGDFANVAFFLDRASLPPEQGGLLVWCRTGTADGKVSTFQLGGIPSALFPGTNEFLAVLFDAQLVRVGDCAYHEPVQPGSSDINGVVVTFLTTPTTRSYKIYRRFNDGPLTLLHQGTTTNDSPQQISYEDKNMPSTAGTLCYYVQFQDVHGNAGPLALLECLEVAPSTPLPTPMLAPLEPAQTPGGPVLRAAWICPPYGVERFRVHVAVQDGSLTDNAAQQLSVDLSVNIQTNPGPVLSEKIVLDTGETNQSFKIYLTPQIGPAFGSEAEFVLQLKVELNRRYYVMVQAVGKNGQFGPLSRGQDMVWHQPKPDLPLVPWPARPLPDLVAFHEGITAVNHPEGPRIRVGEVKCQGRGPVFGDGQRLCVPPAGDPAQWVYRDTNNVPLFPAALYRYQVTNAFYPRVSGDVIQVSPLMESIAYTLEAYPDVSGPIPVVHDPFIRLVASLQNLKRWELYLLDTQPVVVNASYRYILVRFDPQTKEPVQAIRTNPLFVVAP